jgi:hypothetical protein
MPLDSLDQAGCANQLELRQLEQEELRWPDSSWNRWTAETAATRAVAGGEQEVSLPRMGQLYGHDR